MESFEKITNPSRKTILVTDSGLGGLSVFARIASHLKKTSPWENVSMIYFNAWPEQNKGYNHFKTMDQRAQVFNNALTAMEKFQPDMILIACNTLSVVYPFTLYSQNTDTIVSGIVDNGVQLIYKNLMADPESQAIIFGTPTTISQKSHQKILVKMGINPDRIINQGCIDLAGKIERNPFDKSIAALINDNVYQAVSKMHNATGKVYAGLCCTHFGYCRDLFQTALSRHIKGEAITLNPNQSMADHAISDSAIKGHDKTKAFSPDIDMQIVSRVLWEPERINAYARLFKSISPETIKALESYKWNPDLFEV